VALARQYPLLQLAELLRLPEHTVRVHQHCRDTCKINTNLSRQLPQQAFLSAIQFPAAVPLFFKNSIKIAAKNILQKC
jgi:hypothetical protein